MQPCDIGRGTLAVAHLLMALPKTHGMCETLAPAKSGESLLGMTFSFTIAASWQGIAEDPKA